MERFVTKRNANHRFQKQHTLLYLDGIKLFNNFKTIVPESINREYIHDFDLSRAFSMTACNPNGSLYTNRLRIKLVFGVCADLRYINILFQFKNKLYMYLWGQKNGSKFK
jgi:hypothetical protein